MSERYAMRHGFEPLPEDASLAQRFARSLSESMPAIVKVAHDSGDPQVVYHCFACGSGQVIARSDGTIECGFCKNCFTVQSQPRYPAFPQTINGVPVQVPGMGPQWPGQGDDEQMQAQNAAEGIDADPEGDEGDNPFADGQEPDEGQDEDAEDDGGNPFAKKSYRTASGTPVGYDAFLRHIALETTQNRPRMLTAIRRKIGAP